MKLYSHQKKIIQENKSKCGLFLGTGSGKTITALHLAEGSTLVIAPKTIRDDKVWNKNLDKIEKDLHITIISKEDFRLGKFQKRRYDTIIGDEAHLLSGATPNIRYKNRQPIPKCSQVFDKLVEFIKDYPPKKLYLLTATPIRSPMCVWGLGKLLGANWNFYEFRDTFYIKIKKGFREFFLPKNDEATKVRLAKAVQKLGYTGKLEDYFDVPEQTFRDIFIEPTKEQKKRLDEIELEFPDPLVLIGKRHQIENGVLTGDEFVEPEYIDDSKTEVLLDLALEFPKMVIFAKYTMQIAKIKKVLQDAGYHVLTLQGDTKDRQNVIEMAEQNDNVILIVQSQISAGFELPSFPVMVFASMSYSVVDRIQAEGRILRANALKKNLYITLVTKGGVDMAVYKSINNKVDFNEKIFIENL